ncbi:MAG: UDP-N-acetylmuramoyl-tripeptide--D-alanyl-D-alanine ligase [Holosporaceae bacterium]|jgi:UDP-N-acetylmuramoyl-tripeptide--D-alanyl-D-alanine ligase|nr:UDP-N-acetylmuramoyl-tripeptide--D-alanyl-D-alanine ligase [Holosporaceae bacterium]
MIFSKNELSLIFNQLVAENINDICVNSNDAKYGDLFIALKGQKTDGHNFIHQALKNGAVLALSEESIDNVESSKIINVKSTQEALLQLARYNLSRCSAKYIGVTGSVGKTTTKNLIYHLLKEKDNVYVTRKNFNSQVGLPICAATMPTDTNIGIFEMGMSAAGEIKKLISLVQPSISIISKICEAHAEFFDSIWDIARAKSEIFETQKKQEAAIIPLNSPYADFLKRKANENGIQNIFTFGSSNADAKVIDYSSSNNECKISAKILGTRIELCSSNEIFRSDSFIENCLSAILCSHIISEISLQELADKISSFSLPYGRGTSIHIKSRDLVLLDGSYNACHTSTKSAIKSLAWYKNYRKILIFGDMLELGKDEVYFHENLSPLIDKFEINLVFACGRLAKKMFDNLQDHKKGAWCENSQDLAEKVLEKIQNGDCILVKGSNSMKMDFIVNAIKKMDQ